VSPAVSPAVVYIPSAPETSTEPVLWVPILVGELIECELRAALKEGEP